LIAKLVFGMSAIIAITGKSVKLFKGHYTSTTAPNRKMKRSRAATSALEAMSASSPPARSTASCALRIRERTPALAARQAAQKKMHRRRPHKLALGLGDPSPVPAM
jgi:hypothetical protein